jgi:hypothetical protein
MPNDRASARVPKYLTNACVLANTVFTTLGVVLLGVPTLTLSSSTRALTLYLGARALALLLAILTLTLSSSTRALTLHLGTTCHHTSPVIQYTCTNLVFRYTCTSDVIRHTYTNPVIKYTCTNLQRRQVLTEDTVATLSVR